MVITGLTLIKFWGEAAAIPIVTEAKENATRLQIELVQYDKALQHLKSVPG